MLSKPLFTTTLAVLLMALGATQAHAVSSISLGFCTDNRDHCQNKWEIFGDPSWDQGIPATALNKFNNKTEPVTCTAFSSNTEYAIKVCNCERCAGCEPSLCEGAKRGICTGSSVTGQFFSICAAGVH